LTIKKLITMKRILLIAATCALCCAACSKEEKVEGKIEIAGATSITINRLGLTHNGEVLTVAVKSPAYWIAHVLQADTVVSDLGSLWFTFTPHAGAGEVNIVVTVRENRTEQRRAATIVLETISGQQVHINITQNDNSEVVYYYSEGMGQEPVSSTEIHDFEGWSKTGIGSLNTAYHGNAMVDNADPSNGGDPTLVYGGASGGNNISFTGSDITNFLCGRVDTRHGSDSAYFVLRFGLYCTHEFSYREQEEFVLSVSADNESWERWTFSRGRGIGWAQASVKFKTQKVASLYLMFEAALPDTYRLDDITLLECVKGDDGGNVLEIKN
jgi:hypothetical protein